MSSKYLFCNSKDATNHADFRVIFPEPIVLPRNAQVRIVNCRVNITTILPPSADYPSDTGVFYLDCPDLPIENFTGQKTFGKRNNYLGIIPMNDQFLENLDAGEHKTHNYVDLHNSFPLTLSSLRLRVVDEDGVVQSGLTSLTNICLHVRQDPVQRQAERLAELLRPMMVGAQNDNKIAQPTIEINKKGQ